MAVVYALTIVMSLVIIGVLALLGCNYVIEGVGLHPLVVIVGVCVMATAGVYATGKLEEAVG